jgi:hypothetical protein
LFLQRNYALRNCRGISADGRLEAEEDFQGFYRGPPDEDPAASIPTRSSRLRSVRSRSLCSRSGGFRSVCHVGHRVALEGQHQAKLFAAPLQRLITIGCDRSRYNILPVNLVEAVAHQDKSEPLGGLIIIRFSPVLPAVVAPQAVVGGARLSNNHAFEPSGRDNRQSSKDRERGVVPSGKGHNQETTNS